VNGEVFRWPPRLRVFMTQNGPSDAGVADHPAFARPDDLAQELAQPVPDLTLLVKLGWVRARALSAPPAGLVNPRAETFAAWERRQAGSPRLPASCGICGTALATRRRAREPSSRDGLSAGKTRPLCCRLPPLHHRGFASRLGQTLLTFQLGQPRGSSFVGDDLGESPCGICERVQSRDGLRAIIIAL
jgi:hypothetical protein